MNIKNKNNKSNNTAKNNSKKTVELDITEWYDDLDMISSKEVRSIKEQIQFFIKKSIENYKCNINNWSSMFITQSSPTYNTSTYNPLPETILCANTESNASSEKIVPING